jgi:TonB-linked SusC/RagA family outer membrane protein
MVLLFGVNVIAQRTITGTVTEESGEPLQFALVQVKGTSTGITTDTEGKYSINVPEGQNALVFSYTGFKSKTVELGADNVINVTLVEDALELETAVVIGYGSTKREDITASIASIDGEELSNLPLAGVDQAIQGKVAGVVVTSNNGQPGGGISVRIRGNSSINAGNQPLYVIDGIPVISGDFSQEAYGGMDFNAISDLNPNDIASVEVLKDAAASAIYGSRASNGVVLITTKRGSAGAPKINFSASYGLQTELKRYDMLNGEQYTELFNESFGATGDWNGVNTDFMDLVYQNGAEAPVASYDLSIQGGDLKTKYFFGGSIFDQTGTIIGQGYNRVAARLNLDHQATDDLSFGVSFNVTRTNTNVVKSDNNIYGALSLAILQPSNVAAFNDDGSYNFSGMIFDNPVATALEKDLELLTYRTLGNFYVRYNIMDGLSFQTKYGMDLVNFSERNYVPVTTAEGAGANGTGDYNSSRALRSVTQNTLNFQRSFGEIYLDALAGVDYENFTLFQTQIEGNNFPSPDFGYITSAAEITGADENETENRLLSYYTRLNFNISNKYLFTATFRADGSSKFGENNRFGYFPSVSGAWRISNEDFMADVNAVNDLKLRVSYGVTGNQAGITNFAARGLAFGGNNYGSLSGVASTQLPNPDLRWEQTAEFNIGVDAALFNDRIGVNFDFYDKNTNDLLLNRPLPRTSGFTSITQNVGRMRNTGFEFNLNTTNFKGAFTWTTNFQIARNINTVVELYEGQGFDAGFINRIDEGQPLGYFFAWDVTDQIVNPDNGDIDYIDQNDDGAITADDRINLGNAFPDYTGGFTNTLSYAGFDLNIFFRFVQGNEVYNATRRFSEDGLRRGFNNTTAVLNRWQNPGDVTTVPIVAGRGGANGSRNNAASARFVEDGSFVRLQSANLSYTFPKEVISKANISNLKIYVAGNFLYTWTDYSGLDPEVNYAGTANLTLGTDFLTQGLNRTIRFGLNATF